MLLTNVDQTLNQNSNENFSPQNSVAISDALNKVKRARLQLNSNTMIEFETPVIPINFSAKKSLSPFTSKEVRNNQTLTMQAKMQVLKDYGI